MKLTLTKEEMCALIRKSYPPAMIPEGYVVDRVDYGGDRLEITFREKD